MKMTIEIGDTVCTVSQDGVTFEELFELFKQASLGVGFSPETLESWFDP